MDSSESSIKKFFSDNMPIIGIICALIIIFIIVIWIYNRYKNKSNCVVLDKSIQDQIANDIHHKIREIDVCDCGANRSDNSDMSNMSDMSETSSESRQRYPIRNRTENFGNTNFY
jgi:hypothetical protein